MKAIVIDQFGGPEQLKLVEMPTPVPLQNEVLVRVEAAGVNPVDCKIRDGLLETLIPHRFPLILGWDASGVVEKIGSQIKNFQVGDEVFACCRKPTVQHGAYAEYIVLSEDQLAKKPKNLSFIEAASVPLAGLTAYQALLDAAHIKKGEKILIHAAAGGVGMFAVQLAKLMGAFVIGTASQMHHAFVKRMGADEVIDYTKEDFRDATHRICKEGVDVVLDCVGGDVYQKSSQVLDHGGRLVSIVSQPSKDLESKHIIGTWVFTAPNSKELSKIAEWIEQGKIRTEVSVLLPMSLAAKAHELSSSHHTRGKIVLDFSDGA